MRITEQQELLGDVIGVVHSDVSRQFRQHPDAFTLSQCPSGVIPEVAVSNDRIKELKCLGVLNRYIGVADYPEHLVGIRADDAFSLRDRQTVVCFQRPQVDAKVESSSLNCFRRRCGIFEFLAESVPWRIAKVRH